MLGRRFDVEESWLSVVMRAGAFRCVIEARAVARLEPAPASSSVVEDEAGGIVPLARLLGLDETEAPPSVLVRLKGRPVALGVDAVESVVDLRRARFSKLPELTRLSRPAIGGVYDLDGDLLPALDVEPLLAVDPSPREAEDDRS
jgi:hypothetical protein